MVVCQARLAGSVPPTPTFSDVVFPDPEHGWVAGSICGVGQDLPRCPALIEATSDGGSTWSAEYPVPTGVDGLDFLDDRHGFAIGADDCAPMGVTCGGVLLATTDGGVHWSTVYQTVLPSAISDVHFTSPTSGWLALGCKATPAVPATCPGRILATTDGGAHWAVQLSTPGPVVALTSAGFTGLAVVEATSGGGGGVPVEVWRTGPSGAGWQTIATVPAGYAFDPQTAAAINFSDSLHGWLSVFQRSSCAMHGCSVAALWRTSDGGRTWDASPPAGVQCGGFQITFALAPGGVVHAAQGVNLATCDPPETTMSALTAAGKWRTVHAWTHATVDSMAWPRPDDGWAALGVALVHSIDGGASWSQVLPPPAPTAALAVGPDGTLWGAGSASDAGAVLVSHDGGHSWSPAADLPGTVTALSAAGDDLWAVDWAADVGWSLYRNMHGEGWRRLYVLSGNKLGQESPTTLDMFGATGTMVIASGPSEDQPGEVAPASALSSADGGASWDRPVSVPDPGLLAAASFSDPAHGWVLDLPGGSSSAVSVLATADGGEHWSEVALPAGAGAVGLQLLTPTAGWLWDTASAGDSPSVRRLVLFSTTDAARTWRRYDLPVAMGSTKSQTFDGNPYVVFATPERAWAMTATGLWTTADGGLIWFSP